MTMTTASARKTFLQQHEDAGTLDPAMKFVRELLTRFGVDKAIGVHAADETKYLEQLEGHAAPRAANIVGVKSMHPKAQLPRFMSDGASGADLHACIGEGRTNGDFVLLRPTERMLISTGIAIEIPAGCEGQIRPRSGLARNKGIGVLNAPGTIDSDYRGEVHVLLINHGFSNVTIAHGDRIAQLVIAPVTRPVFAWTGGVLSETGRGDKGFGSTGA